MSQNPKQLPSTDVSPLWGYIFPPELCDAVFALAVKVLGVDPNARQAYVGTRYYTARCIEDIGKALLHKAIEDVRGGVGEHTAMAPLLDFKDQVNNLAYLPSEMSSRVVRNAPATEAKPAAKPQAGPIGGVVKPGTKLIDPAIAAELQASVGGIEPAPAPALEPARRVKQRKGPKQAEAAQAEAQQPAATDATPAATDATEPEPAKLAAVG